jgi:hypothetical protein
VIELPPVGAKIRAGASHPMVTAGGTVFLNWTADLKK